MQTDAAEQGEDDDFEAERLVGAPSHHLCLSNQRKLHHFHAKEHVPGSIMCLALPRHLPRTAFVAKYVARHAHAGLSWYDVHFSLKSPKKKK